MRRAVFGMLCLAFFACSEPDTAIKPVVVSWMEWPAEVDAATPFPVRLRGGDNLPCVRREFIIDFTVDQRAMTLDPYYLYAAGDKPCMTFLTSLHRSPGAAAPDNLVPIYWDTTAMAPGLSGVPLTYEVRAAGFEDGSRTFGDIAVGAVSTGRVNAGGFVHLARDSEGCVRITPAGLVPGYAVENPPETVNRFLWVKGYLHAPASPVCGDVRVFYLVGPE